MEMPDDLDAPILFPFAIAVMEFEPIRSEGIAEVGSQAFDLSVVITGKKNYLVYSNYDVLLGYNCAHAYALAVGLLSDRIGG